MYHLTHTTEDMLKKFSKDSISSELQNSEIKFVSKNRESFEKIPVFTAFLALIGFYILIFLGFVNEALFSPAVTTDKKENQGYPSIYDNFERLYFNYVYRRVRDGFERPVCSVPGVNIVLKERITNDCGWTFQFTGREINCINLASYNYLGFSQCKGPCAEDSIDAIKEYGWSLGSTRRELGTTPLHIELEELMAEFLEVEDCITFGMGFAANALNIPAIISEGCLVLSDEKNHASIVLGLKLSGSILRIYRHNDTKDLEQKLLEAITEGQPKTSKPWRKIFIITEGVFSMEGSIVHLPDIIALKKKYKAYLYLDEAHSIGAMGIRGCGVIDYYGCNSKDVDILMGTFTKSFGSAGGYIAGSKLLIEYLRSNSDAVHYGSSMSPPVAQQIITCLKIIMGKDGTKEGIKRICNLKKNTRYFRRRLQQMGLIIYGHEDSPVVPVLVYFMSKVIATMREYMKYNIATAGVGFPATPLLESRIRFCLSSSHTKEDLQKILEVTEIIADKFGLRYARNQPQRVICYKCEPDEEE